MSPLLPPVCPNDWHLHLQHKWGSAGVAGTTCLNCNEGQYQIIKITKLTSLVRGERLKTAPKGLAKIISHTISNSDSGVQRHINREVTGYIQIREENPDALELQALQENFEKYNRMINESVAQKSMVQTLTDADDWLTNYTEWLDDNELKDHLIGASFHQSQPIAAPLDLRN